MKPEIWKQLSSNQPLKAFDSPRHQGRLDLRHTVVNEPRQEGRVHSFAGKLAILTGLTELNGIKWKSIDFTGSRLSSLRFHDCELEDCLFDDCICRDWRMWRTSFQSCSFRRADLRDASLGAVEGKTRNRFLEVDFSGANLRSTGYTSAEFSRCVFKNAVLKKVEFGGSVFTDCVFEGRLEEVLFYDLGFTAQDLSPNELLRADFSKANFRYVEFRRLNLETVRFPQDDEHIRVEDNYPRLLADVLSALKGREDLPSRKLAAIIELDQKWLGPKQRRGVLSKHDILSAGGRQGLELILSLLHAQE